jgi:hypothetical protein
MSVIPKPINRIIPSPSIFSIARIWIYHGSTKTQRDEQEQRWVASLSLSQIVGLVGGMVGWRRGDDVGLGRHFQKKKMNDRPKSQHHWTVKKLKGGACALVGQSLLQFSSFV